MIKIKQLLKMNDYSKTFVNRGINERKKPKTTQINEPDQTTTLYYKFSYIQGLSHKVKKILSD